MCPRMSVQFFHQYSGCLPDVARENMVKAWVFCMDLSQLYKYEWYRCVFVVSSTGLSIATSILHFDFA